MAQSLRSRESFLAPKSARTAALCSGLQLTAPIVALLCTVLCTRPAPTNHPPCSASAQASVEHCTAGGTSTHPLQELLHCSHFTYEVIFSKNCNFEFVHDDVLLSIENACIWWYYHSGRCASAGQLAPPPSIERPV